MSNSIVKLSCNESAPYSQSKNKISFTIKNPAAIDVNYFIVNFENFF